MGTRGYYAYRYRGYYFVYYNHYDSYPSGLGRSFVSEIPGDKEEFDKWLEATKARFEKELARIKAKDYVAETDETYAYTPCARAPENDIFIEWVYTADLDRMVFSVDNGAHFRLDNIPRAGVNDGNDHDEDEGEHSVPARVRDWAGYLSLDGAGDRCLDPATPRAFVAEWLPPRSAPSPAMLAAYTGAQPTRTPSSALLRAAASYTSVPGHVLAGAVFKTELNMSFGALHNVCVHPPGDLDFRFHAKQLLRTAAPLLGSMTLEVDPGRGGRARTQNEEEEDGKLWFRFRNCAIRLATRLDEEQHLRAAVGDAVLHIRKRAQAQDPETGSGSGTKTALLWSIRHFVVVQVDDNGTGQVTHSEAIPILAAYGQDDGALQDGIGLLSFYLRPALDASADLIPTQTPTSVGMDAADTSPAPALPLDVITEVVSYTDAPTFHTLRLVSRATRALWARQARVGPYAIVRAASLRGTRGALAKLHTAAEEEWPGREGEKDHARRFVALYCGKHPGMREEYSQGHGARRVYLIQPEGGSMGVFYVKKETES